MRVNVAWSSQALRFYDGGLLLILHNSGNCCRVDL